MLEIKLYIKKIMSTEILRLFILITKFNVQQRMRKFKIMNTVCKKAIIIWSEGEWVVSHSVSAMYSSKVIQSVGGQLCYLWK